MKNKKIFLMLAVIALTLVLSGCETVGPSDVKFLSYVAGSNTYTETYTSGNTTAVYISKATNYSVRVAVGSDYSEYSCYKVIVDGKDSQYITGSSGIPDRLEANIPSKNISTGKVNSVVIELYESWHENSSGKRVCGGSSKRQVLPSIVIGQSPNLSVLSVEAIMQYLPDGGYFETDTAGVPVSCRDHGIVADNANNLIPCIALSQVDNASDWYVKDCAKFVKWVLKRANANADSAYTYGTYIAEYTNRIAQVPTTLDKNKPYLLAQYNGSNYAHVSIIYYNHTKKSWYSVGGNMSNQVKNLSLQETLNNTSWTRYVYREIV